MCLAHGETDTGCDMPRDARGCTVGSMNFDTTILRKQVAMSSYEIRNDSVT
jgi:hypothetical protein